MAFYHRDQVLNSEDFHLASRGGHANKHPGNKASRQLVRQFASIYVATKKSQRGAIARQLYQTHFQDKRIFVLEREYFLRCIEHDRQTAQQGGPRDSSRRKLSNERVQSVIQANGGSLASILALPSRVFIHTGEAFAIDTVDHLLREEAKKVRRRQSISSGITTNSHDQDGSCSSSYSVFPPSGALLPCTVGPLRSSSVGTIVSLSSVDCTTASSTPSWSAPIASWQPITTNCTNQPEHFQTDQETLANLSVQDFNIWKACSEQLTNQNGEDLLRPITTDEMDDIWSDKGGEHDPLLHFIVDITPICQSKSAPIRAFSDIDNSSIDSDDFSAAMLLEEEF